MKKIILTSVLALLFLFTSNAQSDKEAIKKAIQTAYVEGLQNEGDMQKIDSGIHSDFVLLGINKDEKTMWKYPISDWKKDTAKKVEEGKLPNSERTVTVDFKYIDITGNAAQVKLEFLVAGKATYIDYMSLYKFEDGWKIVGKIFYKY